MQPLQRLSNHECFPVDGHLSLSDFSGDSVPILLQIADYNFRLETLDLSNHECLPVDGLERLHFSTRGGVKSLKLSSLNAVGDADLEFVAKKFPNLEVLDLSCPRNGAVVDDSGGSNHGSRKITDDGIAILASNLKGLRRIDLNENHWVSDKGVITLAENCLNLEEIVVKGCSVTQTGVGFALRMQESEYHWIGWDVYGNE